MIVDMSTCNEHFERFIHAEIVAMRLAKEQELKSKHELMATNEFYITWIHSNSETFRAKWDRSLCRNCRNECRHRTLTYCKDFAPSDP